MVRCLVILGYLLFSGSAYAHGDIDGGGFWVGFNHPVLGFDHLLAMASVGVLSAQLGGKAIWKVPLTFVLFMLVGGLLGMKAISVPFVEIGISLSVLLLGAAVAFDTKLPYIIAMVVVAIFAVFHGHAHGMEMPALMSPYLYAFGFISGTTVIHLGGVVCGLTLRQIPKHGNAMRLLGGSIASFGGYLLYQL